MTNFTRRSQAESKKAIGKGRIAVANKGHGMFGPVIDKISNKNRLAMSRQGARELIEGTIDVNRIDKGLPRIKRPPAGKRKRKK